MKAVVISSAGPYGFGRTWQLQVATRKRTKIFYLGQDVKFCSRILGMSSQEVVRRIGTEDIGNGSIGAKRLGRLIVSELGLNGRNVFKFESWELAAD